MSGMINRIDRMMSFKSLFSILLAVLIFFSSVNSGSVVYAEKTTVSDDDKPIVVSLGDSFSAGEGIEPFYSQELDNKDKVEEADWLAHRSEKSWPGMLKVPGLDGLTREYKDTNWYFVAASGAKTKHLKKEQTKEYSRGAVGQYSGTEYLAPQLDVFNKVEKNSVDYVTLTLGGNDAGFSDIIKEAVTGSTYLKFSKLSDMLADVWADYYRDGGIRDDLYDSYKKIEKSAGKQAQIIVAGYPKLLDPDGAGIPFSKQEAMEINRAVSNFNLEIERIVEQCAKENMKICFVSVEEEFDGHEIWSRTPYLNPIYIGAKKEDLKNFEIASKYSAHPNYEGAKVYARCVNKKIEQLAQEEEERLEQEALNPTPKEREIVLVLDQSGSMAGTPMVETKSAALKFVETVFETEANVGIVTYHSYATVCSALTDSEEYLDKRIGEISTGGGTNIEEGLKMAGEMLENSDATKKIIVLMSDGEPNEGKVGESLIDYANDLKEKGYYIYTLGFFSDINNKEDAYSLMEGVASEGCHFEVDNAESLKFFFGDIADQISGTEYIYIRIACPVDVTVEYNGEIMTSVDNYSSVRTSFGTMTFEENTEVPTEEEVNDNESEKVHNNKNGFGSNKNDETTEDAVPSDNRVKILRLKEGVDYDVKIEGNGDGNMNYSIGFMDENGEYNDVREFQDIKITNKTKIDTVATDAKETYMYVDKNGDGDYDITYMAREGSEAKIVREDTNNNLQIIIISVGVFAVFILFVVMRRRAKIKKYLPV